MSQNDKCADGFRIKVKGDQTVLRCMQLCEQFPYFYQNGTVISHGNGGLNDPNTCKGIWTEAFGGWGSNSWMRNNAFGDGPLHGDAKGECNLCVGCQFDENMYD